MSNAIIVVGASAGGLEALSHILRLIPAPLPLPLVITKHLGKGDEDGVKRLLDKVSPVDVIIAEDKEKLVDGSIYIAPGGYHLQVESNTMLSLCSDYEVCYSRPSIDVLFESTATVFGPSATAIILTGANQDGAKGIQKIWQCGGTTIAQKPETAQVSTMPQAAIHTGCINQTMDLAQIADFLTDTSQLSGKKQYG